MCAARSADDEDRSRALSRYGVLDTPPEPAFDRLARLAARALRAPAAVIAFVDGDRAWIKAAHGVTPPLAGHALAFYREASRGADTLVVSDAGQDERFAASPAIAGPPGFRACAAAALTGPQGARLGALCVFDTRPHRFLGHHVAILQDLAVLVTDELELRLANTRGQTELDERRRADAGLRALRDELETRVQHRTAALAAAESRYRSIFENAVEGIYQSQPGGGFLSVNPALARLLGYASPEAMLAALHDPARLYVQPERRAEFEAHLATEGALAGWESEVYRADGSRLWISENARAIRDEQGNLLRYEGTFDDVTARRAAEEGLHRAHEELEDRVKDRTAELALLNGTLRQHILERECAEAAVRRSESKFRALIENAQDLITVMTPDGIMLYQSPSVEHILGYAPDDLIGEDLFKDILHPDDHGIVRRCAEQIVEAGEAYVRTEARYRHRDGSWRLLESISSSTPPDSAIIGLVVNSRDITERRRTERSHEARTREQTAVAELGRFALAGRDLSAIFEQTAELVARALQVPFCTINEILPGSEKLLVRAGTGWREGSVGGTLVNYWRKDLPASDDPSAVEQPLIIADLHEDVRYESLLAPDGVAEPRSAASVVIHCDGRRYGTLCVLDPEPGRFTSRDATFLQTVADLLSAVIESERHKAASREVEARYQRIAANTPGMVYQSVRHADGTATVPFVSEGCRLLYGLEPAQLRDRPELMNEAIHPDDFPAIRELLRISNATLTPLQWDGRLVHPSGEVRWVTARSRPERLPNGDIYRDGLVLDVTELKRAQHEMLLAKEEAEKANRAKSDFLSRISHELRTPLNAILGFGQLLGLEHLTPVQYSSVDQILKGGRHLLDLINEVLDITRIEAGGMELNLEPVVVADVLTEATRFVRPLAEQCRVRFACPDCEAGDRRAVLADRGRLHQILLNLLSNAVKYNREDGEVRVTCTLPDERTVRIAVADTGPGLQPDEIARLFTPFERLGAAGRGIDGTGIGLTICRSLAHAMGGTVGVESVPDSGSTFFVDLPAAPAGWTAASHPTGTVPELPQPVASPDDRTILLIDDQAANVSLVERVLEARSNLRLLTAVDGRSGLDAAREKIPDLILLDLHLPDFAGDEVMRRLRHEARTRDIPVVVLSADATPTQIARLRQLGVRDYLTKPFRIRELLAAVDGALTSPAPVAAAP